MDNNIMCEALPITLIIPTMNRVKDLQLTLESYFKGRYIPNQIIIVDQSDESRNREINRDTVKAWEDVVELKYLYQKEKSLTKARNNGCKYIKNDIVIMSDDDITVQKNTLKDVYELMNNSNIALIAGYDENSVVEDSWYGYLWGTKNYKKRNQGYVTKSVLGRFPNLMPGVIETEWAMGFFTVFNNELRKKWNISWDENLWGYGYAEDLDFSYRFYCQAKKEKFKCILSDKVVVNHRVSNQNRTPSKLNTYMYVANREYLANKFKFGIEGYILNRWVNLGQVIFRLMKNERPLDIVRAQIYCDLHRKEIIKFALSIEKGKQISNG